jgi:hypothetical protein
MIATYPREKRSRDQIPVTDGLVQKFSCEGHPSGPFLHLKFKRQFEITDGELAAAGMDHVLPVPLRAVSLPACSARRCRKQETGLLRNLPMASRGGARAIGFYRRVTMILTSIIVTGLVFNGIGGVIGYVLGFIEAENFYRIKR